MFEAFLFWVLVKQLPEIGVPTPTFPVRDEGVLVAG
jgi:hypothetical protein